MAEDAYCDACHVCGDSGYSDKFGVYTCKACLLFIWRTMDRMKMYSCVGIRDCPIDKIRRGKCSYCRFMKCVESWTMAETNQKRRRGAMKLREMKWKCQLRCMKDLADKMKRFPRVVGESSEPTDEEEMTESYYCEEVSDLQPPSAGVDGEEETALEWPPQMRSTGTQTSYSEDEEETQKDGGKDGTGTPPGVSYLNYEPKDYEPMLGGLFCEDVLLDFDENN